MVSNERGLKWTWSQMNVVSNEVVSNEVVLNEYVSNEWSQIKSLNMEKFLSGAAGAIKRKNARNGSISQQNC